MSNPRPRNTGLLVVLGAALVAFALKGAWALNSFGTSDLFLFQGFAEQLSRSGLAETYRSNAMFNHTPLTALFLRALNAMAGGELPAFSTAFRVVTALADLGTLAALLVLRKQTGRPPWWTLALFAASPVAIVVSGFHGNVDPLMTLFLAWAAVALVFRRPLLCGLAFALASQMKIVPLLLAPLFLAWWWQQDRPGFWKFSAAAAVALLAGAAVPLLECPAAYLHNVFGYSGYWGTWGFTYWLHQTGAPAFQTITYKNLSAAQSYVGLVLKCLMIAGILTLAWRRRAMEPAKFFSTLTAAFTVIFVFAPGVGPQYLVWIAPFLAWSRPRWFAIVTAFSAAYMFAFYHPAAKYEFPWDLVFPKGWEIAVWGPWMNLPWLGFIALMITQRRRWWRLAIPA